VSATITADELRRGDRVYPRRVLGSEAVLPFTVASTDVGHLTVQITDAAGGTYLADRQQRLTVASRELSRAQRGTPGSRR
jgi:hypothetical protein